MSNQKGDSYQQEIFKEGLKLFRDFLFWEAHEKWEELWRINKSNFVKGIIQISAAFHKIYKQKNVSGFYKIINNCQKYFQDREDFIYLLMELKQHYQDSLKSIHEKFCYLLENYEKE